MNDLHWQSFKENLPPTECYIAALTTLSPIPTILYIHPGMLEIEGYFDRFTHYIVLPVSPNESKIIFNLS